MHSPHLLGACDDGIQIRCPWSGTVGRGNTGSTRATDAREIQEAVMAGGGLKTASMDDFDLRMSEKVRPLYEAVKP